MGNSKIVYYGETLIDLTGDTVAPSQLRSGITAHDKAGDAITGTLADATQATPAITVSAAGLITASATQTAGVVAAGTKSSTKQLTVQAAKTVTPSTSSQTAVASRRYTTGAITVAAVYACIGVTYPSGSTCTCTNGTKTLTAKDTTGTALFVIPSAGTWTVTAVNGSQSASKSVNITTEGQVESVTLSFELVLFENGTLSTLAGSVKGNRVSVSSSAITTIFDYYSIGDWYFTKAISFADYKTLKITMNVTEISSGERTARFGVRNEASVPSGESDLQELDFLAYTNTDLTATGTYTFSVDVSKLGSTTGYVTFGLYGSTSTSKVWLE